MLAAVLFLPLRTGAVSATSAYVLDAVSGRVLFSQNPDRQSLIASTTKIMTALIALEEENIDEYFWHIWIHICIYWFWCINDNI